MASWGNPPMNGRFVAGKIIYKWAMASMAMVNNQRVLRKVGRVRNPEATSVAKNCGNSP